MSYHATFVRKIMSKFEQQTLNVSFGACWFYPMSEVSAYNMDCAEVIRFSHLWTVVGKLGASRTSSLPVVLMSSQVNMFMRGRFY